MNMLKKALPQAGWLIVSALILGFTINAVRSDGLPVLSAWAGTSTEVQLEKGTGEIELKDAVMLFLSKRAVFVDARSRQEYDEGHIQGALSLPVDTFGLDFDALKPELAKAGTIITYCDGELCELGHDLANILSQEGFPKVYYLKNGLSRWKNEKLPIAQKG